MFISQNKKIIFIILTILIIITLVLFVISKVNKNSDYNKVLEEKIIVPSYAKVISKEECQNQYELKYDDNHHIKKTPTKKCINKLVLSAPRKKGKVEDDIQQIKDNYNEKTCNSKKIYYDSENDLTFFQYSSNQNKEIVIEYMRGNINNDDCKSIKNIKDIEYGYDYSYYYHPNSNMTKRYSYLGTDGLKHDVYSECGDCLTIKDGTGTYGTFKSFLYYSYMDMNTLLAFLEYQSDSGIATKSINDKGTLFTNDKFQVFVCGSSINNDIYINDKININDVHCKKSNT